MTGESNNWGKVLAVGLLVVGLAAGGVWAGRYWLDQRAQNDLNARLAQGDADQVRSALLSLEEEDLESEAGKKSLDITAERMKEMSFSEIMAIMRSKDLTEEQRDHMRRVGFQVMRTSMKKNVDEYFDAPKAEREKILDRQIDEWMEFMNQMEAYREQHKDDPEHQADQERERERWRTRNTQEAKQRMEGGNPDEQKRMFFYWGQMRARAEARGLDMGGPWGRRSNDAARGDRPRSERSGRRGESS